jgi:hypothetical protein
VDTIARLCCVHHPDYNYQGAPPKEDVFVAKAQDVISKAKAVNVESQITTEDIDGLLSKDDDLVDEESSNGCDDGDGSDDPSNNPAWVETVSGVGGGGGSTTLTPLLRRLYSLRSRSLITPRIPTTFTSVSLILWSVVQSQLQTAAPWRLFTWSRR